MLRTKAFLECRGCGNSAYVDPAEVTSMYCPDCCNGMETECMDCHGPLDHEAVDGRCGQCWADDELATLEVIEYALRKNCDDLAGKQVHLVDALARLNRTLDQHQRTRDEC